MVGFNVYFTFLQIRIFKQKRYSFKIILGMPRAPTSFATLFAQGKLASSSVHCGQERTTN
jgi:hypothetical protein